VAREGGNETESAFRDPVGNLEKVVIGRRGVGASIQSTAHLLKMSLIAVPVEALRR
jgi:hypothetical protein